MKVNLDDVLEALPTVIKLAQSMKGLIEARAGKPMAQMSEAEAEAAWAAIEIRSARGAAEEGRRRVLGESPANDGPDEVGGSFTEGE